MSPIRLTRVSDQGVPRAPGESWSPRRGPLVSLRPSNSRGPVKTSLSTPGRCPVGTGEPAGASGASSGRKGDLEPQRMRGAQELNLRQYLTLAPLPRAFGFAGAAIRTG